MFGRTPEMIEYGKKMDLLDKEAQWLLRCAKEAKKEGLVEDETVRTVYWAIHPCWDWRRSSAYVTEKAIEATIVAHEIAWRVLREGRTSLTPDEVRAIGEAERKARKRRIGRGY